MFKRLMNVGQPKLDLTRGSALAHRMAGLVRKGKVATAIALIDTVRDEGMDQRQFYVRFLASILAPEVAARFAQSEDAMTNLVLGYQGIELAWRARSARRAIDVPEDAMQAFVQIMNVAAGYFRFSAEVDPTDPNAYAGLIYVSMGLGQPLEDAQKLYRIGAKHYPAHRELNAALLTRMSRKWGGSHAQMMAVAEDALKRSRPGTTISGNWFMAMAEHYLYINSFDNEPALAGQFLEDEARRARCADVFDSGLAQFTQVNGPDDYWAFNYAAWWFYMVDDCQRLQKALDLIDGKFTDLPWAYAGSSSGRGFKKALNFAQQCS